MSVSLRNERLYSRIEEGAAHRVSTFVVETAVPSAKKASISNANLAKMGFVHVCNRSNFTLCKVGVENELSPAMAI